MKLFLLTSFLLATASAFTMPNNNQVKSTALSMKKEDMSKVFTSGLAAAIMLSSAVAPPAALAEEMNFGSDNIIAARSGGRGGGRSSAPRAAVRSAAPSSRTVINRTTVIAPPVSYYSPPVYVSPFGSPFGGIGYGALGAVSAIGNEIRDARQENEIYKERTELELAKQRQAELERRLYELEANQRAAANQAAPAAVSN
jgi:hypothetical protein